MVPVDALQEARRLARRWPREGAAWSAWGRSAVRAGQWAEAIAAFSQRIRLEPGKAEGYLGLLSARLQSGEPMAGPDGAKEGDVGALVGHLRSHHGSDPRLARLEAMGWRLSLPVSPSNSNTVSAGAEQLLAALENLFRLGELQPPERVELAELTSRLRGSAAGLHQLGALVLRYPGDAALWVRRGEALRRAGLVGAGAAFQKALQLDPNRVAAWDGLGLVRREQGRLPEAEAAHREAVARGNVATSRIRLAGLLLLDERCPEAVDLLTEARRLGVGIGEVAALALQPKLIVADWAELEETRDMVSRRVNHALKVGELPPIPPLHEISSFPDPLRNLAVARAWARSWSPRRETPRPTPRARDGRLRVAYLSYDFRNHPVAHLVAGLFRRHDRGRFEVVGLSLGPDDQSRWRRQIAADVDHFWDCAGWNDAQIEARFRAEPMDILVDLMGHTKGHRMGLCARRLAPVQLTWLGYPGTTGADCFDGIVVDRVVAPDPATFSEPLVSLPVAYQPVDMDQPRPVRTTRRSDWGLPENGLVLACFNQAFKIEPVAWGEWMSLLGDLPGSVLWLLAQGPRVEANLRREALTRGVDPGRLVFAAYVDRQAHLERLSHADIGLDPRIYGSHTTTSDALYAGLPLLTCLGDHFASRVCGSILLHAGLSDLVRPDRADLGRFTRNLLHSPELLRQLRQQTADLHRPGGPFDTDRFVRVWEAVLESQWARIVGPGDTSA